MVIHYDEGGDCLCGRSGHILTKDTDCVTCKFCVGKLMYKHPFVCPRGWYLYGGKWHMPYNGATKPKIYLKEGD